jgi:alanyl-tRNA synthetase
MSELFFHRVTDFVTHLMGEPFPELLTASNFLVQIVQSEERRFRNTLNTCLPRFSELVERVGGEMPAYKDLARLYDTYGMPPDLIKVMLEQQGHHWQQDDFDAALTEIQQPTHVASAAVVSAKTKPVYQQLAERIKTTFTGYQGTELLGAKVLALVIDDNEVDKLVAGQNGEVILDHTPFYAESGGQIGDTGVMESSQALAKVIDTFAPLTGLSIHKVEIDKGELKVGSEVVALVDTERRRRIMLNHTATHLLHAALREVLGLHIKQAGSLVAPDRLRFDFTHYAALTEEEIQEIEQIVNAQIQNNSTVSKQEMDLEAAMATGAMALFGEKYSSRVRVVHVPGFSSELCGGTHVNATGDIGLFKITADSSIAAGIRRLEAITGPTAVAHYQQANEILDSLAQTFKSGWQDIPTQVERLQVALKAATTQVEALKLKLASQAAATSLDQARTIAGVKVLAQRIEDLDRVAMRQLADNLAQQLGESVVVLGMVEDSKAALVVRVAKELTKKLNAGKIIKELAPIVGGNGGGKPDLAEAGGRDAASLDNALNASYDCVERMLA